MLYHRDNHNVLEARRKIVTLTVLIAVSVFVLSVAPVRKFFAEAVYLVTPQMWAAGTMVSERWELFLVNFHDKENLFKENAALRDEVNRMQAQILDRNLLAERVATLEGSLGRTTGDNRVMAGVIVNYGRSPYDILVVDAGSANGVTIGDSVVLAGSGVIGEIIEVTEKASKVKLFSSPGVEISAAVGKRAVPILALGRGMGNFEAKISENSPIVVGDRVVSAKGNLILGLVVLVEEKSAEPFKRIYFRQPFNIFEIRSVEIIASKRF